MTNLLCLITPWENKVTIYIYYQCVSMDHVSKMKKIRTDLTCPLSVLKNFLCVVCRLSKMAAWEPQNS